MNSSPSRQRSDWLLGGLFLMLGLVLYTSCRSRLAYHWDGAQFALAVHEYDISLGQPHPPGYFLYVMLGRLVDLFLHDPHASLVWISVVTGALLSGVLYLMGASMSGRRAGLIAAALALTSPLIWFHSGVALTYIVDALLVCLTAWWAWRTIQRGGTRRDAVVLGLALAVVGGVRQQSVLALLPLLGFTVWQWPRHRLRKLSILALSALVLAALWLVPMIQLSGGWAPYQEAFQRHAVFNAPATWWGGGGEALRRNLILAAVFCLSGLTLGALVLLAVGLSALGRRALARPARSLSHTPLSICFLGWWAVPMILFGTVIGFTKQPGYVLGYLPACVLLLALVLEGFPRRVAVGLAALVSISNVLAFLSPRPANLPAWLWPLRTWPDIRTHDQQLASTIRFIRSHYDPRSILLCHADQSLLFGLRHFQLYLPEYRQIQLSVDPTALAPTDRPLLGAEEGRLVFRSRLDLAHAARLVLLLPPGEPVTIYRPFFNSHRLGPVPGSEGRLYEAVPPPGS